MNKGHIFGIICLTLVAVSCKNTMKPGLEVIPTLEVGKCVTSKNAAVACAHPEAARIGAEILAKGGNAIDASIAIQWALAVCYPEAGNIGGGGFMVLRMADGSVNTLDFRESAPAAAHRDIFLDANGKVVEGKSTATPYAAGIPGTVHGLFTAHERYGKLPMESLIQPSILLASKGFPLTEIQAQNLNEAQAEFNERNSAKTAFRAKNGGWKVGDSLVQKELAATLERIKTGGLTEFYGGTTADMLVDATYNAVSQEEWFSHKDLAAYTSIWREAVTCEFDSIKIVSMPPPSSGGIALCQMLDMLQHLRIDTLRHNSAGYIHALVEVQRRVYADRASHLGDPDSYPVPVSGLLQKEYNTQRISDFNPTKASKSIDIKAGTPNISESSETTHLSVVDSDGNAVAVTTTLNDNYGSKIVVDGAGFLLNNEMDDFSAKPGVPNMFGLLGGEANAVAAHKRMLSSMTPTIVEKNGKLFLVAGSPGGSTIITSVLQTVLNATVHSMPLDEVINAPKFHSQWLPDVIYLEYERYDSTLVSDVENMGHSINYYPSLGRVDAIMVLPDGKLNACGDVRSDDAAAGY
jgi:gamma-glutamyltranspeptidase/glutathione hydrolase